MSDIDPKSEDLTPEGETPETDVVVEGIEDVQSGETDAAEAPVVVEIAEDAPPTPEER
ncbi:MAG: hypothetical protein HOO09_13055, partial [Rhodospirillaceae bacterium]|nr:hypothetical protein [Rhodospirillaceae bacterium]